MILQKLHHQTNIYKGKVIKNNDILNYHSIDSTENDNTIKIQIWLQKYINNTFLKEL